MSIIEVAKLKNSQKYGTIRLNQRDKSEFIEMIGGNDESQKEECNYISSSFYCFRCYCYMDCLGQLGFDGQ